MWGLPAEACARYLAKGRRVAVTGRLALDRWTAEEGTPRRAHRIVAADVEFLDPPGRRLGGVSAAVRRYQLAGARGGQGTTTVATVLAALAAGHGPTTLAATRPDDVAALATGATPAAVVPRLGPGGTRRDKPTQERLWRP